MRRPTEDACLRKMDRDLAGRNGSISPLRVAERKLAAAAEAAARREEVLRPMRDVQAMHISKAVERREAVLDALAQYERECEAAWKKQAAEHKKTKKAEYEKAMKELADLLSDPDKAAKWAADLLAGMGQK